MLRSPRFVLPLTLLAVFSLTVSIAGCSPEDTEDRDRKVQDNHPHQVADATTYRFVGYSTITVDGAGNDGVKGSRGIAGMYSACRSAAGFGPKSRMCTSQEYASSPNAKSPSRDAWVQPVAGFRAPKYFSGSQAGVACRATSSNILDWGSVRGKGVTIAIDGSMKDSAACNVSRPVTCCAPE